MTSEVNHAVARFFMDQCIGSYPGHMSNIHYSPTIYGLCSAHGVYNHEGFAQFLRQVADQLDPPKKEGL